MSCISHVNLCPSSGDTEVVLLQKILQSFNEGAGSGGVAGVSSINVNGSGAQTGAVSITIPGALLNFTDENGGLDGVAWRDGGATEVFRTQAGSDHVRFAGAATRLHTTSALTDQFTFLATDSKANGAFLEVYGTGNANLGGAVVAIHDGGLFRIRSAPVASLVQVTRVTVEGTSGNVGIGTTAPLSSLAVGAAGRAGVRTSTSGTGTFTTVTTMDDTAALFVAYTGSTTYGMLLGANDTSPVIQGYDTNTAIQLSLNPYGGNLGVGVLFPNVKLDVANGVTTAAFRLYHTRDGLTVPVDYSRLTLSHNAAATGRQTANFLAETGGTGADDIDIRLQPTGDGGFYLGPVADGTAVGGNARGVSSIDLSLLHVIATAVASGAFSTIIGGYGQTASGSASCVVGGSSNIASNTNATVIGGDSNTASGLRSVGLGGTSNLASGSFSVAQGFGVIADKYGQVTQGNFMAAGGDMQSSVLTASRQTTDGTANVELFLDGAAATARCTIATDTTWTFCIYLVARRTDADNESAGYKFEGVIDNNAGTTALVGTVTKTVLAEDTAAWDADVVASDANDALVIQVTGEAAKTINWVARITLVETTG